MRTYKEIVKNYILIYHKNSRVYFLIPLILVYLLDWAA